MKNGVKNMNNKTLKIPTLIFVIGLIAAVAAHMLTGIVKAPTITEQDFDYSLTYRLGEEEKTIEGVYRCTFLKNGGGTSPLARYYDGVHLNNSDAPHSSEFFIAEKDGLKLCVVAIFNPRYLMGDDDDYEMYEPYLAAFDEQGAEYSDEETLARFDAELLAYEMPQPIENSFRFVRFSGLHSGSMISMTIVGLLVILAGMIFVKRDKTIPYNLLDKFAIVLNCAVLFLAVPILLLLAELLAIVADGNEAYYLLALCAPAITAFTVAASIVLRRKGFSKTGFFVQFAGPVLFFLALVWESTM